MAESSLNAVTVTATATAPTTMAVPTLPTLPDPNTFWSQPGPSSLFLLQEARANISILNDLKSHIQSGTMSYNTLPPRLTPLPPIPRPSTSTIHPPTSTVVRPNEKPDIPVKWKGKGKGRAECINLFNRNEEWIAEEGYNGATIKIIGPGMIIWITIRDEEVGEIKVFLKKAADLTSSGWHVGLSHHLSSLHLSLPELLYRIPYLPDLLTRACFYCSKYLKMPDGMPVQHTGYLAGTDVRTGEEKKEQDTEGEGEGKWVCWHDSCGDL